MSAPIKQPSLPGMKKPAPPPAALPWWLAEVQQVRAALLCCAATLLAAIIAISACASYRAQQEDRLEHVMQQRNTAASLFNQAENEKQEIRAYEPRFIALRSRGLIGDENRLGWIDAIRRIQAERKLLPIAYEISPQQILKPATPALLGPYQLRGSKMTIQMDLLHEMDLLDFFDELRRYGYFAVQQCALKRSGADAGQGTAPLNAECSVLWLTLANQPGQP